MFTITICTSDRSGRKTGGNDDAMTITDRWFCSAAGLYAGAGRRRAVCACASTAYAIWLASFSLNAYSSAAAGWRHCKHLASS